MNGGLLLNVGPSAIALVALGFAAWQIRADRIGSEKSNSLPVASSAFNEFRSQTFQDHLRTVWNEAPSVIPEDGFQSLPTQWRNSAYEVVYFFEYLGILVAYELVPKELVVDFSANLIVRSWNALEPFIQQERLHRKKSSIVGISAGFVTHFEHLVKLTADSYGEPVDDSIHARLNLRKFRRS